MSKRPKKSDPGYLLWQEALTKLEPVFLRVYNEVKADYPTEKAFKVAQKEIDKGEIGPLHDRINKLLTKYTRPAAKRKLFDRAFTCHPYQHGPESVLMAGNTSVKTKP